MNETEILKGKVAYIHELDQLISTKAADGNQAPFATHVTIINLRCRPEPFGSFFDLLVNKIPDTQFSRLR